MICFCREMKAFFTFCFFFSHAAFILQFFAQKRTHSLYDLDLNCGTWPNFPHYFHFIKKIFQDRMGNFGGDAGGVFYDYYEEEYSDEDDDVYEAEVRYRNETFFCPRRHSWARAHTWARGRGRGGDSHPLRVYPYSITYEPLFTVSPPWHLQKNRCSPMCARAPRILRAWGGLLHKICTLLQWDREALGGGGHNPDPLSAQVCKEGYLFSLMR